MVSNVSHGKVAAQISEILKTISPPARISILLVIGRGEACVCHLEAVIGKRQAYISQHLMALRQAGILLDRRDGRFVYYRIADPALLELVQRVASLAGVEIPPLPALVSCECPYCAGEQGGEPPLIQIEPGAPSGREGLPG